jgi:superfamily II DNA or RNA helicase
MVKLESIVNGAHVLGIEAGGAVEILKTTWYGSDALGVVYRDLRGRPNEIVLYRDAEPALKLQEAHRQWGFDADPELTRLTAEALRIRMAYHFDPHLAIHSSDIDPLPHQITAVYEAMLPRQPLRFLLADDPGAGKTIMTGLLMKELSLRGDLERCLIVCPGSLAEQWQDELSQKFDLPFEIFTADQAEASRTGNWFQEHDLVICRLDQLSRNDTYKAMLETVQWDLVVVDEAHKMSASYYGDQLDKTKRYELGELLGKQTRHFLLLSATPHNGKETDFQLFMALLDGDRFEGKYRQAVHTQNAGDLMRRMIKEQLVKMDGSPLFPERKAYTMPYDLSPKEAELYDAVTNYVREEFNRAEQLDESRKRNVGFALTVLQRRLASSPEAIYQSLVRRHERLKTRLDEARIGKQAEEARLLRMETESEAMLDDIDEGLATDFEEREDELADRTTAALSLRELEAEILTLERLIKLADDVRKSGQDKKWEELSSILQDRVPEKEQDPAHRKLVIFTEHRDTLNYLERRITNLLGRPDAVVTITGGMSRDERRRAQERFTQDRDVEILIATDAAGEGINLQRAHLMVNYDLPWNPNRLEQRFGRIHRIGQREVCHLWNLVAEKTLEGHVYRTLLQKLQAERDALDGKVFDVLGSLRFGEKRTLRDLLVEAIRYGNDPEVKARLDRVIDGAVDPEKIEELLRHNALHQPEVSLDVREIAEAMERANARRLQPHYIASFFEEAFSHLGGKLKARETGRYEISHVPSAIRERARIRGRGAPLLHRYERITFERQYRHLDGKPTAAFIAPGHPLLDATIDLILARYRGMLRTGAVLVDDTGRLETPRVICVLEHEIVDGRTNRAGDPLTVSKRMQFVEIGPNGEVVDGGPAPYLDFRPPLPEEAEAIEELMQHPWMVSDHQETAIGYAVGTLAPNHLNEVRARVERMVERAQYAVHERLTHEIARLNEDYLLVSELVAAGKTVRRSPESIKNSRDGLMRRLESRLAELELQKQLRAKPPTVLGAFMVVPKWAVRTPDDPTDETTPTPEQRRRIELAAMEAVMAYERLLGYEPRDVSGENAGYDIESRVPGAPPGTLRLIEVKGRAVGADTVTLTRNEILTALNSPDRWMLALVEVGDEAGEPTYLSEPLHGEPEPSFRVSSVTYRIEQLHRRGLAFTSSASI